MLSQPGSPRRALWLAAGLPLPAVSCEQDDQRPVKATQGSWQFAVTELTFRSYSDVVEATALGDSAVSYIQGPTRRYVRLVGHPLDQQAQPVIDLALPFEINETLNGYRVEGRLLVNSYRVGATVGDLCRYEIHGVIDGEFTVTRAEHVAAEASVGSVYRRAIELPMSDQR